MAKAKEPKPIQANAKLKKMDVVKGDVKLSLTDVTLSPRQAQEIKRIIDDGGSIIFTILEEQQGLGMDGDGE